MHAGYKNIEAFLLKSKKFLISTHESPDGDGLGAEIAFNELLRNMGKTTYILNSDPVPDKYLFMDIDNDINVFKGKDSIPADIEEYSVFVLDTNDFENIGALHQHLENRINNVFIIDHHEGGKDKLESNFIRVEASSASEIVYMLFNHYKQTPSFKAAQALYVGILFDTGSFRYPKTSPETFKAASHLVECGANPNNLYEQIYENNALNSFWLRSMILSTVKIHFDGRLIMMFLKPEMIEETGASFSDGELAINLPLTIKGVIASILLKQDVDGPLKVSMRTKGDYDVAKIAIEHGGGGHKNAAGFKSNLSFDQTAEKILDEFSKFFI